MAKGRQAVRPVSGGIDRLVWRSPRADSGFAREEPMAHGAGRRDSLRVRLCARNDLLLAESVNFESEERQQDWSGTASPGKR